MDSNFLYYFRAISFYCKIGCPLDVARVYQYFVLLPVEEGERQLEIGLLQVQLLICAEEVRSDYFI